MPFLMPTLNSFPYMTINFVNDTLKAHFFLDPDTSIYYLI